MKKIYLCIDLKSFYASVECIERGLDPMTTNLVVADNKRTEKTICLAVTPSLKSYGISGRARLFEVVSKVKDVNSSRRAVAPKRVLTEKSYNNNYLLKNPSLELDYIIAPPRMAYYIDYSTRIYNIYLKYVSPEDILVYSIDEVFMDITNYLELNKKSPREFAMMVIRDVYETTGITATAGIGTNMYLAKIAMDIYAKKQKADQYGVRIAELDEISYRKEMWTHRPLTDFWRIGKGTAKKLESHYLFTMGDIARTATSKQGRKLLKKLFGINAKLLVDHAFGYENCTIAEAKAYTPENNSISSGQVLHTPYTSQMARTIVREMTELMVLDLVEKNLVTNQVVLTIGYDIENLTNPEISRKYQGEIVTDPYGRKIPKHSHGTENLERFTSSTMLIMEAVMKLYDRIINEDLLVRRVTISANRLQSEDKILNNSYNEQLDLFTDYEEKEKEEKALNKERKIQKATIDIRNRYGKNAILKGTNLQKEATTKERNGQIGGHKA